jgi:hypothetical protein
MAPMADTFAGCIRLAFLMNSETKGLAANDLLWKDALVS